MCATFVSKTTWLTVRWYSDDARRSDLSGYDWEFAWRLVDLIMEDETMMQLVYDRCCSTLTPAEDRT